MRLTENHKFVGRVWRTFKYDLDVPADMVRYVAREMFAWPGGYELILSCSGASLCPFCVRENYQIELMNAIDETWADYAISTSAEIDPENCFCDMCNKDLSAYAEETKG